MMQKLILLYNAHKGTKDQIQDGENIQCCELTTNLCRFAEADAVIFYLPFLTKLDLSVIRKPSKQKWVAWSMESEDRIPLLKDIEFMSQFDITISYRQDSTIWHTYFNPATVREMQTTLPHPKTESALAVMFMSSGINKSNREQFVLKLMQKIKIDSYGRWQRNKTLTEDKGRETKLSIISRYKFTLAFENSICQDYVTEKIFEPLIVGSVPVYLGAPNIDEYAPAPKSFINVHDFPSVDELAEYLTFLSNNEAEYNQYLTWKKNGISESFIEKAEQHRYSAFSKLCKFLQ